MQAQNMPIAAATAALNLLYNENQHEAMSKQTRERGPLLTAWLALTLVANVATAAIYGWTFTWQQTTRP
jgi:hypothetical protein